LLVNHHSRNSNNICRRRRRRRYIPWEFNASTDIGSNNICRRRRRYIPWEFNASTEEPGSVKQVVEENR
jgi:hypothetical protein